MANTYGLNRKRNLNNQLSKWAEMSWKTTSPLRGHLDGETTIPFNSVPNSSDFPDYEGPHWFFKVGEDVSFNGGGGLYVTDVKLITDPLGSVEQFCSSIEPKHLKFKFRDGLERTFDIAEGIANSLSRDTAAEDFLVGVSGKENGNPLYTYQYGLRAVYRNYFTKDIQDDSAIYQVTCEITYVFKLSASDFDPGESVHHMNVYPQITWSYNTKDAPVNGTSYLALVDSVVVNRVPEPRVDEFEGAMKMALNPRNPANNEDVSVSSLWTDNNNSPANILDGDERKVAVIPAELLFAALPPGVGFGNLRTVKKIVPAWSSVFDYNKINLATEYQFDAVYAMNDAANADKLKRRKRKYRWPDYSATNYGLRLIKYPRQGMYDNIHTTGRMIESAFGHVGTHAPFCGVSCVHFHWRWGQLSDLQNITLAPTKFRGWNANRPNAQIGNSLIPPNQGLEVAIVNDDADVNANGTIGFGRQLLADKKVVWYKVKIHDAKVLRREVILENGLGYAYKYNTSSFAYYGLSLPLMLAALDEELMTHPEIVNQPSFTDWGFDPDPIPGLFSSNLEVGEFFADLVNLPAHLVYHTLYDYMRYFYDAEGTGQNKQQIPSGDFDVLQTGSQGSVISMENL
jgi:hypothetical protein